MPNRNSLTLASFVVYCNLHPEERFWQALRNWSGYHYIYVTDQGISKDQNALDTFYWEGKDKNGA